MRKRIRRMARAGGLWLVVAHHAASQDVTPSGLITKSAVPGSQEARFEAPALATDALFGADDASLRRALSHEDIAKVERGRGGRSLGFRITLKDGTRGYFKPAQSFSAANWFGEVAAYHLDRMLGLGRVPAVVSRAFPWRALRSAAGSDKRVDEVTVEHEQVVGAFVAWVDGSLRPMPPRTNWERWVRVAHWSTTAVTPFQRQSGWLRESAAEKQLGNEFRSKEERARLRSERPEPDSATRPAELSDLILFDYLTRNLDRWGGRNANVLVRGTAGPLVFLDNGAGFASGPVRPELGEARLHVVQRFRRRTIAAIRAFDLKRYAARLDDETVTPVLSKAQLAGLETRRRALLSWVEGLRASYGEAIWLLD